jgi:hypothetical protein
MLSIADAEDSQMFAGHRVDQNFLGQNILVPPGLIEELSKCNEKLYAYLNEKNRYNLVSYVELTNEVIQDLWLLYRHSDICNQKIQKYMETLPSEYQMEPKLPPWPSSERIPYDRLFIHQSTINIYQQAIYQIFDKFIDLFPSDPHAFHFLCLLRWNGDEIWIRRTTPSDTLYSELALFTMFTLHIEDHNSKSSEDQKLPNRNTMINIRANYQKYKQLGSAILLSHFSKSPHFEIIENKNGRYDQVTEVRICSSPPKDDNRKVIDKPIVSRGEYFDRLSEDLKVKIENYLTYYEMSHPILYQKVKMLRLMVII